MQPLPQCKMQSYLVIKPKYQINLVQHVHNITLHWFVKRSKLDIHCGLTCHLRCLIISKTNRVIDWPYRDTRLLRERLRHEVSRRTSIKQDICLSSSCSTSKHHTRVPFDAVAARILHVIIPASAE